MTDIEKTQKWLNAYYSSRVTHVNGKKVVRRSKRKKIVQDKGKIPKRY